MLSSTAWALLAPLPCPLGLLTAANINVHAARGTVARHEARNFGPDQARHGPMVSGPGERSLCGFGN